MPENALAKRDAAPPSPMDSFKAQLEEVASDLHTGDVPVERIKSAIIVAVQKNPDLLRANRLSFWRSARMCAFDGLLPDGREAALVTFRVKVKDGNQERWEDHVQYLPMVYGVIKRVRQSGAVQSLWAETVHENDTFTLSIDDETGQRRVKHDFNPLAPQAERGRMVGAYAVAKLSGGSLEIEVMSADEIDAARRTSRSQKDTPSGPWGGPFAGQMWEKTVLKRLAKRLPASGEALRWHDDEQPLIEGYDEAPRRPRVARGRAVYLPTPEPEVDAIVEHEAAEAEPDDNAPAHDPEEEARAFAELEEEQRQLGLR